MSKNNGKNKEKKKKEKIIYVDDGRTIADMSPISGRKKENGGKDARKQNYSGRSTLREQFETYIGAVKLMFLPMLAVLGVLAVTFIILYIILSLAG